jgi:hypothetical protein
MVEDEDLVLEELGITRDGVEVDDESLNVKHDVNEDDDSAYSTLLGMSREE